MSINKAQSLTYDFFLALSIFLLVLNIALARWYFSALEIQEAMEKNFALKASVSASQVWFKEGYPKYWDLSNVNELGLANDGKINWTKVEMLSDLGYSKVVSLLGLGTYNLCYELYNKTGGKFFAFPQVCSLNSAKDVNKVERVAILDEQPVKVRTLVWR